MSEAKRRRVQRLPFEVQRFQEVAVGLENRAPLLPIAVLLLGLGRAAEAVAALHALTAVAPEDASAWRQLGGACEAAGRPREAERALRRAVELDPDYVAARIDLGKVLLTMDRIDEAAGEFAAALDILPGYPPALLALATAEERRGRPEVAV